VLPAITRLTGGTTRPLALLEQMSAFTDGPAEARLGIVDGTRIAVAKKWEDAVTENPAVGATEVWEYYNTTADAHPMHIHEAAFQVVNRQDLALDENDEVIQPIQLTGNPDPPEPWESGWKDTVIAYPSQVTRLRLRFAKPGQFVWHCHIVEHEDNEMMRPYRIGPLQPGQPE
jgi:FtsP/CotA-like multicopper oxidase with cupredoxin domain